MVEIKNKILERFQRLSKKQKAYFGVLCLFAAILLWAFVSAGIITHNFNRSQIQTDGNREEALIEGIILTETKEQHKYWEIYGENGNYDSKNGVALLNNVIGNFYDDNNEVSMSFESSKGTYNQDKNKIILYENTYIVLKDLTTLKANKLEWSGNDNPVVASGNVQITRGDEFLALADKVIISPTYEEFKIEGNTTTKIFNKESK